MLSFEISGKLQFTLYFSFTKETLRNQELPTVRNASRFSFSVEYFADKDDNLTIGKERCIPQIGIMTSSFFKIEMNRKPIRNQSSI
jgi:hypothetical protein